MKSKTSQLIDHLFAIPSSTCENPSTDFLKSVAMSYTTDDLIFDWEEEVPLVVDDSIELPQHNLVDTTLGDCTKHYSTGNFTCIEVVFTLKRRLGYYMFHTYIPTCLIVIMSWISFWIKPEAVPARVTLCVTSLLTLSTQHAQSQKSLPPVSYIKAIDIFMSSCTVFVFASLMEYALVNILLGEGAEDGSSDEDGRKPQQPQRNSGPKNSRNVVIVPKMQESSPPLPNGTKPNPVSSAYRHNRHRHRALLVDKISRVVFPLSFVILNTAYWSVYLDTVDGPLVL
ncbi:glycine receptor subunit alpha-1 [Trichonephila inaurata madagascariensis]|uniref:Glycine receptor subunit alpha-1 n=1 Tax=Trichonephila inaurata madagascariensis TaxID=2747483 RepID=A0A8X6JRN9_9ARAC|nr:glycine receptor subunit alpha-1 [Trichonephila inaurata madagascariensis]